MALERERRACHVAPMPKKRERIDTLIDYHVWMAREEKRKRLKASGDIDSSARRSRQGQHPRGAR
jgi:hypothetical protein